MSRFKRWAEKEFGTTQRIAATLTAGLLFVIILPLLIITFSFLLDTFLNLPIFFFGIPNLIIGGILLLSGTTFALWSIFAQLTTGKGTPLPVMATQKLLITPPFSYCRNPMSLGTIIMYLGLAILIGSISGIAIVLSLSGLLLAYIKEIEEPELEERFGAPYKKYKETVPFLIPRLSRRD